MSSLRAVLIVFGFGFLCQRANVAQTSFADAIIEYDAGHSLGPHVLDVGVETDLLISVRNSTPIGWPVQSVVFDFSTDGPLMWDLDGQDDIPFTADDGFAWSSAFDEPTNFLQSIDPPGVAAFGQGPVIPPLQALPLATLLVTGTEVGEWTLSTGIMIHNGFLFPPVIEHESDRVVVEVVPDPHTGWLLVVGCVVVLSVRRKALVPCFLVGLGSICYVHPTVAQIPCEPSCLPPCDPFCDLGCAPACETSCDPTCDDPCSGDPVLCLTDRYQGLQVYDADVQAGVRLIFGVPMTSGSSPCEAAQKWIECHADALGVDFGGSVRLELQGVNQLRNGAFTLFDYEQHIDGVPVDFSRVHLVVLNSTPDQVVLASAKLLTEAPLGGLPPDTVDGPTALGSVQQMAAYSDLEQWGVPKLVISTLAEGTLIPPIRAWRFTGSKATAKAYTFFVSAADGTLSYVMDEVHDVDVAGGVTGNATPGLGPDSNQNPPALVSVPGARVRFVGLDDCDADPPVHCAYAGSAGECNINADGLGVVTVESDLLGEWFDVGTEIGSPLLETEVGVIPPALGVDFTFNDPPAAADTAQVNCMIHAMKARELFTDRHTDLTVLDVV